MEDVVIVGGGIAGLATAVALKRVGIEALVLERSEELRAYGAALGLAGNAWLALDALGVSHKLRSKYTPLERDNLVNPQPGRSYKIENVEFLLDLRVCLTNIETGTTQEVNFSGPNNGIVKEGPKEVHRKVLLEALAEELPAGRIRFSSKLTSIQTQTNHGSTIVVIHLEDGATIKSKVLIGCDGVHSIVARWLGLSEPVNSGQVAMRSLSVFPEGHGLNHEIQQFIGVGKRGGYVPIDDREIYTFLVYNSPPEGTQCHVSGEEDITHDPKLILKEVTEKYGKDFPSKYHDIVLHSDLSTLSWAPLKYRRPWNVILGNLSKGTITVAGDAMHPTTPNLGQGGCIALEDAVVLGRHIGESYLRNGMQVIPEEMSRAIENYVRERRWRAAWVITASFLSGWLQEGGAGRWTKFFRDVIFYRFFFPKILRVPDYDCGKLPEASQFCGELGNPKKID